ncbi:MAG TPA: septum formation initiator family protein [Marinagarivorans sp.]
MNKLLFVLTLLLIGSQYRLWVGDGSLAHLVSLKRDIAEQQAAVDTLSERNRVLLAEVAALKQGSRMIEEKARTQLGMIKEGETFFMFAD